MVENETVLHSNVLRLTRAIVPVDENEGSITTLVFWPSAPTREKDNGMTLSERCYILHAIVGLCRKSMTHSGVLTCHQLSGKLVLVAHKVNVRRLVHDERVSVLEWVAPCEQTDIEKWRVSTKLRHHITHPNA